MGQLKCDVTKEPITQIVDGRTLANLRADKDADLTGIGIQTAHGMMTPEAFDVYQESVLVDYRILNQGAGAIRQAIRDQLGIRNKLKTRAAGAEGSAAN